MNQRQPDVFVIVENIDSPSGDDTLEVLVIQEGAFSDENKAEERVNAMNKHFVERKIRSTERRGDKPTKPALEAWETHYGYIPLEVNSGSRSESKGG